ncbi:MAG: aminotransferase class I and II [Acidobacteriota bacterium]|nr:aminotransferase class I and II [Acidobacteriota bacterium]
MSRPNQKLRTVKAMRYVTPLREGGSLPAIIEGDDDGLYVLKFRGAGQGVKALIAELVAGEIGRALDLRVPEIVFVELDARLARTEPDPEIQDLIKASGGLNLALDYLPGSITFDPLIEKPLKSLASKIVWFDAFTVNVDRTARNANMLWWHKHLWLIDHGAALFYHHNADTFPSNSRNPFRQVKDHMLLRFAGEIEKADIESSAKLTPETLREIVNLIPGEWLGGADEAEKTREIYYDFLTNRLRGEPREFVKEAINARRNLTV